ncbi:MAG: YtxH domain-containing protein [Armatimonadota bacterium]
MSNKSEFMLGLVIGGAVGAAVALLYAPRSGAETRDQLKHKGDELKDGAHDLVERAVHRAEELGTQVKDRTAGLASTVRDSASQMASRVEGRFGIGAGS